MKPECNYLIHLPSKSLGGGLGEIQIIAFHFNAYMPVINNGVFQG